MSTSGDKIESNEPSGAYNIEDDESEAESERSSITLSTEDTDREQDDTDDEEEIKTLLEDMTYTENASKQVHSCMEGTMEAKKHYLEKEREAYDKLEDIRRELKCLEEIREEQTSLTLQYVIVVYNRIEKLRVLTHGVVPKLEKQHKESLIEVEENAKQHYQGQDQHLKNKFDSTIDEIQHKSDRRSEKASDKRPNSELQTLTLKTEELENENVMLHDKNKKHEDGEKSCVVPKLEKQHKESLIEVEENAKQHYPGQVQHLKNKFDSTIDEIQHKSDRRSEKASVKRPNSELQTLKLKIEELENENIMLHDKNKKHEDGEKSCMHQMKEIKDLRSTVVELEKENEMLNATVDEKIKENLRLDTELQSLTKEKERITVDKKVLQTEMDELRKELIDKHVLLDLARKTLSRSKSLCDLTHHSKEEIKIRSNIITRMCRESNEEQQQIFKDHTETLYESTGRSKSLQSLMQNFVNDDYLPQDETGMFGSAEDVTERERTVQGILKKFSMASKTTTTVQNNYNIITSNATFQNDCLVEAITPTANSDRAITDSSF